MMGMQGKTYIRDTLLLHVSIWPEKEEKAFFAHTILISCLLRQFSSLLVNSHDLPLSEKKLEEHTQKNFNPTSISPPHLHQE